MIYQLKLGIMCFRAKNERATYARATYARSSTVLGTIVLYLRGYKLQRVGISGKVMKKVYK